MSIKEEKVQEEVTAVVSVMGQALASPLSEKVEAGTRVLKSAINGGFLEQLASEFQQLQNQARIRQGLNRGDLKHLYDLLKFIDEEVPDEEMMKAMKSIFFHSITEDRDKKEIEASYHLMKVCRQLSSMEILILKSCWELKETMPQGNAMGLGAWTDVVSNKIGYELPEFVSASDDHLTQLGLIGDRIGKDRDSVVPGSTFRLTNLGVRLCKHITAFDTE